MEKECFLEKLEEEVYKWGFTKSDFYVLINIADRESDFIWQDNRGLNKDGTTDWGYFQINDIWEKELIRLASIGRIDQQYAYLDFRNSPEDNITTALIVYKIKGVREWTSMR